MSARLATVAAVLLTACAGWDIPQDSAPPPPAESPVPSSHYAPPPPVGTQPPGTPPLPEPQQVEIKAAIASVQLIDNCPDPEPPAGATPPQAAKMAGQSIPSQRGDSFQRSCTQSTVQLSLRSDVTGPFRIEAIRLIDPTSKKAAGTTTLRAPTRWSEGAGMYTEWDGRVDVKTELKISYKLGELDLTRAAELVGPDFNTFGGPFVLELDVSVDGHRQTIRSPEFSREPPHMMVT